MIDVTTAIPSEMIMIDKTKLKYSCKWLRLLIERGSRVLRRKKSLRRSVDPPRPLHGSWCAPPSAKCPPCADGPLFCLLWPQTAVDPHLFNQRKRMWMGLVLGLQHSSMMGGVTLHMYFIVVCGSLLLLVKIIHNLILHRRSLFLCPSLQVASPILVCD